LPKYRYQCECGVQFSERNTVAKHSEPKPCPDCGDDAARRMPETIEGHFNKEVDGPGPQNTGIHDLDTHIDRVIGQSAAQSMAIMEERSRMKRELIRKNGMDPKRLARLPDGQYVENSPDEQAFAVRANRINSRAMTTLRPDPKPSKQ
jgi:putative FmdB family regulatory protein